MSEHAPRTATGVRRRLVLATVALAVVLSAAVGTPDLAGSSSSTAAPSVGAVHSRPAGTPGLAGQRSHRAGALNDTDPAVANLDPDLLDAVRRAATRAALDGIRLEVNSGWRSVEHQAELFEEAVEEYGSEEEAARWVATPERSAHVSGDAVDIGGAGAAAWLAEHGATYGLCQIYRNEPWHFELRPDAVTTGCPAMYDDPTEDPRLQD